MLIGHPTPGDRRAYGPPRGSAPYLAGASPLRPTPRQKPFHEGLIEGVVPLPLVGPEPYTLSERKTTGYRCTHFQDHLVLETILDFRIILGLENAPRVYFSHRSKCSRTNASSFKW